MIHVSSIQNVSEQYQLLIYDGRYYWSKGQGYDSFI